MSAATLAASGLHAGYGRSAVLHDIDLEVAEGRFIVVLGANGAGKTTLLRALSGVIAPQRGSITVAGRAMPRRGTAPYVRAGVRHVPQGRGTFAELSVEDNLRVGALGRSDAAVRTDVQRWYDTFPRLFDRRRHKAGHLSGGEQQMLALARTCLGRPRFLLCDEPSLGLAPVITQQLFEVLGDLNRHGTALLVVEQNAELALERADHAYVLETGRIATSGPPEVLLRDDALHRAYLGY